MSVPIVDHYAILGIPRNATLAEIKKAYHDAAQRFHPDKNSEPGQTERFLQVQQAYDVLHDPKLRTRYDSSLPAESPLPVTTDTLYSRTSLLHLQEPQMVYALLEFTAETSKTQQTTTPLNVCLVLDISTSMQGKKLDMVKATAVRLLRELGANDMLGLVTFSDRAEVVVPVQFRRDAAKSEARIQMMQAGGSTEILQGLRAGIKEVRRNFEPGRLNQVVLITDGHTYGDEQACIQLAGEAASQGIGISALGIGADWNDNFLDKLAGQTGGTSIYIAKPEDISRLLSQKFQHLSQIFAEDVTLIFDSTPGVHLTYAFRLQPEAGPISMTEPMRLGSILRETALGLILEFKIDPIAKRLDQQTLLNGRLKFEIPQHTPSVYSVPLALSRPITDKVEAEVPPPRLVKAMSRLSLYRMQEKAREAAEEGQYDQAARRLTYLATHLLSQGERGLAKTVLLEADQLQKEHTISLDGQKQIKYGTKALLLPGLFEE